MQYDEDNGADEGFDGGAAPEKVTAPWFKMRRDTAIYLSRNALALYVLVCAKATYKDGYQQRGIKLKAGQFLMSRRELRERLQMHHGTLTETLNELSHYRLLRVEEAEGQTVVTLCNREPIEDKECAAWRLRSEPGVVTSVTGGVVTSVTGGGYQRNRGWLRSEPGVVTSITVTNSLTESLREDAGPLECIKNVLECIEGAGAETHTRTHEPSARERDRGQGTPPSEVSPGIGNANGNGIGDGTGNKGKPPIPPLANHAAPGRDTRRVVNRGDVSACVEMWGQSLRALGNARDPRLDEYAIAQGINRYGLERMRFALKGYGLEARTENFDPRMNVTVTRLFKHFAKFEALGTRVTARDEPQDGPPPMPTGGPMHFTDMAFLRFVHNTPEKLEQFKTSDPEKYSAFVRAGGLVWDPDEPEKYSAFVRACS